LESYEITYIVRPDLDEEQIRAVVDGINGRLRSEGELVATFPWNPARRRLAYPIRDFGDGFYVTTSFRYPTSGLKELERALRLNDNVLRFLLVEATDLMVQQAVQRAQQAAARAAAPPEQQGAPSQAPAEAAAPVAPASEPAPAPQAAATPETTPAIETVPATEPASTESQPPVLEVEVDTLPEAVPAASVEE
jgi:small subunit ribosomal protein S6